MAVCSAVDPPASSAAECASDAISWWYYLQCRHGSRDTRAYGWLAYSAAVMCVCGCTTACLCWIRVTFAAVRFDVLILFACACTEYRRNTLERLEQVWY